MKSNKYDVYPLLIDDMERMAAKILYSASGIKPTKKNRNHKRALQMIYSQSPELKKAMDTIVMAEEWHWLKNTNRNVIFPASYDVCDKLLGANIDLNNTAPVVMPHESFVFAMPAGYTYKGIKVPPALVSWGGPDFRDKIIWEFSQPIFGVKFNRIASEDYDDARFLMFSYRIGDEIMGNSNFPATFRACIPEPMIPGALRCKNAKEYLQFIGDFDFDYMDALALSERDSEIQFNLVKLVLMSAIYTNSFPGALRDGFPGKPPNQLEPRLHKQWTKSTISTMTGSRDNESQKGYHYRSWHFRQLMHKRYYQGKHAAEPVGSRVVFVKETMVNRTIEAETVEQKQ